MSWEDRMDNPKRDAQDGVMGTDRKTETAQRPWVKPAFEREPLKDALSGSGFSSDGFACS